jgi:glycosyltransferase involved in cell wall biosynthesis
MLGTTEALPDDIRFSFLLFRDRGKSQDFQARLTRSGVESYILKNDTPRLHSMIREVESWLRRLGAVLLCCHGYKADVVGVPAARRAGIPVIAVAHGWTAETWKVRLYEALDQVALRWMDRVVCVSKAQAAKVCCAGVRPERIAVILNATRFDGPSAPDPAAREELHAMFSSPPELVVGSAGRLSPEKGFGILVEAAPLVTQEYPGVGFVHFGDGVLRSQIEARILELGLEGRFVLAGFRDDLDRHLPNFDLTVLPSFTEGLPNVVLESLAAGVPVVATAVGGTPEVLADGVDGLLVPPGDPEALASRISQLLAMGEARKQMGLRGRERVRARFTFEERASRYRDLFADLLGRSPDRSGGALPHQALAP